MTDLLIGVALVAGVFGIGYLCGWVHGRDDRMSPNPNGSEGHGQPCYYCGEPCNDFAGNPSKWSLGFPHRDAPGVVKWQHTGCVLRRLPENQGDNK